MDWHRIPNSLVLAIAAAFYAIALAKGLPAQLVITHTLIAAALLLAFALMAMASPGAVKLTAAIVLWLGFEHGSLFVAGTYLSLAACAYILRLMGTRAEALPVLPFALVTITAMAALGALPAVLTA